LQRTVLPERIVPPLQQSLRRPSSVPESRSDYLDRQGEELGTDRSDDALVHRMEVRSAIEVQKEVAFAVVDSGVVVVAVVVEVEVAGNRELDMMHFDEEGRFLRQEERFSIREDELKCSAAEEEEQNPRWGEG
jgi:hypothetical protein